jgi:hypothetical protein
VAEGISVDQGHEDSVAIGVDRLGDRELVFVKQLHKEKLADRAESGEVEPVVVGPMLDVLSILFDTSKRVAA